MLEMVQPTWPTHGARAAGPKEFLNRRNSWRRLVSKEGSRCQELDLCARERRGEAELPFVLSLTAHGCALS